MVLELCAECEVCLSLSSSGLAIQLNAEREVLISLLNQCGRKGKLRCASPLCSPDVIASGAALDGDGAVDGDADEDVSVIPYEA